MGQPKGTLPTQVVPANAPPLVSTNNAESFTNSLFSLVADIALLIGGTWYILNFISAGSRSGGFGGIGLASLVASVVALRKHFNKSHVSEEQEAQRQFLVSAHALVAAISIMFIVIGAAGLQAALQADSKPQGPFSFTIVPPESYPSDLTISAVTEQPNSIGGHVVGTISNTGKRSFSTVQVNCYFYSAPNVRLQDGFDIMSNLNPGESWQFKIWVPSDAKEYRIVNLLGTPAELSPSQP